MALKPKQVLELLEVEKKQILNLEKKIDSEIQSAFKDGDKSASYQFLKNINLRVIQIVRGIYQKSGWKVAYDMDREDNRYLIFRLKRNESNRYIDT